MNILEHGTLLEPLRRLFGDGGDAAVEDALRVLRVVKLNGGETLMRQGDPCDGVYFVVSGRLRAYAERNGGRVILGDISRGETVGETGVFTGEARSASVIAVRDSVLAYADRDAFVGLWRRHPGFSMNMARVIVDRVNRPPARPGARRASAICLVPITDGIDVQQFGEEVARALGRWGQATFETRETINARFGRGAADAVQRDTEGYQRLATWLEEIESRSDFVLLLADDGESEWTRRCIRACDEVLLVARADAPPRIHPIEQRLFLRDEPITGARQTLLLLHPKSRRTPTGTTRWLDRRPVDAHLHIRPELPGDLARLARMLSGNTTGLVLSGGGARGFAHLGVYKALEEAGFEIDMVGGTSIGSVMSAYVAFDLPVAQMIEQARKAFVRNPTADVNYLPLLSLIQGRRLKIVITDAVVDAVGCEIDAVDTWKTFYCVSSSYSRARELVITRGPLERALRSSVSIPVALPPVTWNGELLVDGGIFNNFPADVMVKMGARKIIGVDLAPQRDEVTHALEEIPSPWSLFWDRCRGRNEHRLPNLGSMLVGTTMLYSASRTEEARRSVDLYINPRCEGVGLLDWKAFDRAVDVGYRA
ncbi:MAG TPA: patatin-like phospholipase family protein, partial [Thermoanaerobaculia bacterium]|nr:patatin-like phospholipase family protein [Thermoanaerobaculia bacterium]